jgi:nitrogen-specific signal transduction histidine kinase/CheY-like chemotaxis protein
LKGRLGRLAPAVERAIEEVNARRERERLEARFIEAQKMEVIGQLAGGVAHDFNNVLAVIMGYNEVMIADLPPQSDLSKYAQEIRNAAERAAGLTKQLLVFSRKQTVQPVVLNLEDTVQKLNGMLARLIGENIEMRILSSGEPGYVLADSGYIGQVVMNLVVNARDAMPRGGKLVIAISNVTLDQEYADAHPGETPGDFVKLSVGDTGAGMTDEVKARLFETFFTTKPIGEGTGLGLATCQSIVRQSGGHIGVSSELGQGTTFNIYFPRTEKPAHGAAQPKQRAKPRGGTETLLVVEDEESLRNLARHVLECQGYHVISVSNGQAGLRAAREHKGAPISLVITDVIMPVMDGKEMADQLNAEFPDLKILFTSGYTDNALAHHGVLMPGVELLLKPHTPAELVLKVRELLDEPSMTSQGTVATVNQRMLEQAADTLSVATV